MTENVLLIDCPHCGKRDQTEFAYGGDGSIVHPPLDAPAEEWVAAVFERENVRGRQTETWQHRYGCRMWLRVERDTFTHEIHAVVPAHPGMADDGEDGR